MDLLAGLNQQSITTTIALGHSFGATVSLMAAVHAPERFRALILLDPALFAPERVAAMKRAQATGDYANPLVERAIKRRSRFGSAEEAHRYWRSRPLFAGWPEAALRLYTQSALETSPDGRGLVLRWSPEWEAYYFSTGFTRSWEVAPKLRGLLPTLAIGGGTTDTYVPEIAAMLRDTLPEVTFADVPGHGHLFPQSAPEATTAIISAWLDTLK